MVDFEKEKEKLNAELTDCKSKLLKLGEKEKQWEADFHLLKKSEAELKSKLETKETELQGRSTDSTIQSIGIAGEIDTDYLSKEMS